jgi:hypothetical protein
MKPNDCPNWNKCNAPFCPLWNEWQQLQHLKGEPVCYLLREVSKHGGQARLQGCVSQQTLQRLAQVHGEVMQRCGPLKTALVRASLSGSRIANIKTQGRGHEKAKSI